MDFSLTQRATPGDCLALRARISLSPLAVQGSSMLLLTPGPVTTRPEVRAAAALDYAPWDLEFRALVSRVCSDLLAIAGGRPGEHVTLPLQGCGHFAMEAAVRSLVPPGGRLLVPMTGDYAEHLARLAREAGREVVALAMPQDSPADPTQIEAALRADPAASHLAIIYSETSTGVVHPVPALAAVAARLGRRAIVDAVSAFGALPLDLSTMPAVDAVGFTSNKCLEGLPGAVFVIARTDRLRDAAGRAGSWSLDLADLYQSSLRRPGSHRFTPAAGVIAALAVALDFYRGEGGQPARLARYRANQETLCDGIRALGLDPILPPSVQGPIVVNIAAPVSPAWDLQRFVDLLKARGVLISNFGCIPEPSFRVGCIGAIEPADIRRAVAAMSEIMADMGVLPRRAA
jgi:2-aminoethylphosphonate-pyruvate transaminase